jgi:hypothetical protein
MMLQVIFNAIYRGYENIQQEGKKTVPSTTHSNSIQFNSIKHYIT